MPKEEEKDPKKEKPRIGVDKFKEFYKDPSKMKQNLNRKVDEYTNINNLLNKAKYPINRPVREGERIIRANSPNGAKIKKIKPFSNRDHASEFVSKNLPKKFKSKIAEYTNPEKIQERMESIIDEYEDLDKIQNEIRKKLEKLKQRREKEKEDKDSKVFKALGRTVGCLICGSTKSNPNAKFCINCGMKLLIYRPSSNLPVNEAKKLLKHALKEEGEDYYSWTDLASIYYHMGKYKKAIKAYEYFVNVINYEDIVWVFLGNLYGKLGKYVKALECYQKASEKSPENLQIKSFVGLGYALTGDSAKAIEICKEISEKNSRDKIILLNYLKVCNRLENYNKALELGETIICEAPNFHLGYIEYGHSCVLTKDYLQATELLRKAINLFPNNNISWKYLALVYYRLKDYKNAVELFWQATSWDKYDFEAWYYLAAALLKVKLPKFAEDLCKSCLHINSEFEKAIKLRKKIEEFKNNN